MFVLRGTRTHHAAAGLGTGSNATPRQAIADGERVRERTSCSDPARSYRAAGVGRVLPCSHKNGWSSGWHNHAPLAESRLSCSAALSCARIMTLRPVVERWRDEG